ncbi:MAG: LON peptidase substrate-binding domain-containing protein [Gammaproteobacteria bacterium]|nr:LON peptidase substrate-binding domain-containing protein [Gammaproteobacteria bacterium]MBT8135184.1 LON peptidase substrate-binding domain-containing protein [Gammaproteobacteria bacterium]NNJ49984.1 peptidase S16 [Gammaproteobacteria bacterium]
MKHALFPLNTVLFPGSILPLQIFEQRYLNMVTDCMKQQTGFVVVLISEGKEVGTTPQIYSTGCYVEIIDWESLNNGLLGITIQARYRARLSNSSVRDDGLLLAEASPLYSTLDDNAIVPDTFKPLSDTLKQLLQHPFAGRYRDKVDFDNSADICYRLGELLPISNKEKQLLLETETTEQMLDQLALHINALQK